MDGNITWDKVINLHDKTLPLYLRKSDSNKTRNLEPKHEKKISGEWEWVGLSRARQCASDQIRYQLLFTTIGEARFVKLNSVLQ